MLLPSLSVLCSRVYSSFIESKQKRRKDAADNPNVLSTTAIDQAYWIRNLKLLVILALRPWNGSVPA